MNTPHRAVARSITKSIGINRAPSTVFDYLSNPSNWPQWAIVNVKSVAGAGASEWRDMMTPHGPAKLRIRAEARYGILDHDWHDPQASWTVPARVVPNGDGAEFMMTFFQPPAFSDSFFDEQIKLVDIELAKLKQILEAAPGP
jgi:uncharacterized protein YndB with AHSA1/START domain